jgi:hypothetical protein
MGRVGPRAPLDRFANIHGVQLPLTFP